MTWKRIIYIYIISIFLAAGIFGILGALFGGFVVYNTLAKVTPQVQVVKEAIPISQNSLEISSTQKKSFYLSFLSLSESKEHLITSISLLIINKNRHQMQ